MEPYTCCSCHVDIVDEPGRSVSFDLKDLIFFCNECANVLTARLMRRFLKTGEFAPDYNS
jgi:hypothetical protein